MLRSRTRPTSSARRTQRGSPATAGDVLIRGAAPADAHAIERLAILDDHALPQGERLVGEVEGRVVAALEVDSGEAVADPFAPTAAVVELLGLRAAQVRR